MLPLYDEKGELTNTSRVQEELDFFNPYLGKPCERMLQGLFCV